MAGLYIHIPFCKQKCYYCDFHFSTNRSYQNEMTEAMIRELELQKGYLENENVDTIYFGGGTPSILEINQIDHFLSKATELFSINPNPEITLEANPDDLSGPKLKALHSIDINRLSIGIQSFNDEVLRFLNRAHDAEEAKACVMNARETGFKNISTDLIFSIPGASDEVLERDLETTLSLDPEHISTYSLTIEEKTVFGNWYKKGRLKQVTDHTSARQFEYIIKELEHKDYEQYEVSNFCRDGFYSRHNSSYWKNTHYLGIGPGAHSYNGISRQFNLSNNPGYINSLKKGIVPFEFEEIDNIAKINEYLLTTLRTKWGCDLKVLENDFGCNLIANCKDVIESFKQENLIEINGTIMFLTKKGILLADEIIGQLFQDRP